MAAAKIANKHKPSDNDGPAMAHIYGQNVWHDDVFIVANVRGLQALKRAIEDALAMGHGEAELLPADGECYNVVIFKFDHKFGSPEWNRLAVPYTEEYAREKRDKAIRPWELIKD